MPKNNPLEENVNKAAQTAWLLCSDLCEAIKSANCLEAKPLNEWHAKADNLRYELKKIAEEMAVES